MPFSSLLLIFETVSIVPSNIQPFPILDVAWRLGWFTNASEIMIIMLIVGVLVEELEMAGCKHYHTALTYHLSSSRRILHSLPLEAIVLELVQLVVLFSIHVHVDLPLCFCAAVRLDLRILSLIKSYWTISNQYQVPVVAAVKLDDACGKIYSPPS